MGSQPGVSAVQRSVLVVGSGHTGVSLLSPGGSESGDIVEECYGGATTRSKGPSQEDLSAFFLKSNPEWVVG